MNKFIKSIIIILVALFVGSFQQSCTDLDETVYSNLTSDVILSNPDNTIYLFGAAYTSLYTVYGQKYSVGIDCGTDITCVPQRGGDWVDGNEWHRYHRLTWTPDEGYVSRLWQVIYQGITTINKLIYQLENIEDQDLTSALAELKTLRAFYYLRLVDTYGNVPIVTDFPLPDGFLSETSPRSDVYAFIETEVEEALPYLPRETGLSMYGRMNYYTAQMILAKLYLNASIYTGSAQLDKASIALDSIIAGPYSLTGNQSENFVADASGSTESIFAIPFDQVEAAQFEIHVFTLHYLLNDKFGVTGGPWNGLSAQESLYNLLAEDPLDARINGLLYGEQYDADGNQYQDEAYESFSPTAPAVDPDGPGLNLTPVINMLEPNCLRQAGARIAKFPFIEGSDSYTSNDFPVFRLADALLMKAEVLWRQNGDNDAEALDLVNQVRGRAGASSVAVVNSQSLLDERARELFAEGHRRSDMVRFGVYTAARWEKPEVSPDYVNLWPVPNAEIQLNSGLLQNPGY